MLDRSRAPAHAGEIPLRQSFPDLTDDAVELARFWVNDSRSFVAVSFPRKWEPELLGHLLVESLYTAAASYAALTDLSEEEALQRMWRGLDEERVRLHLDTSEDLNCCPGPATR